MRFVSVIVAAVFLASGVFAQKPALTWEEVREKFQTSNPTLQAAQLSIAEARAQETTAYLRPNPEFTLLTDGNQLAPSEGSWRPVAGTLFTPSVSYLHKARENLGYWDHELDLN